ncbi:hypothetical protein T01_13561 [Trichinella spiralis]|uniref:Uncharacterized protein n=1 Tax=Trichinella spiralis TaxID=6334 RepID=A0A0V1AXX2_TRISP|nr:hypothetical protein T01_13561 [Trichinella spiralis]
MAPSRKAVDASSFHRAVDIAFFDVRFGVLFVDKLKLLAPHSRFLVEIINFKDHFPECGH